MEISDIIENSLKYPLSDFKKFLILGIPNLVIAIFATLFILQMAGLSSLTDVSSEAMLSSPLFSTFIVTTLLFMLIAIICSIMMSGIGLSVIRQTIQPSDLLPDIQPLKNFVDGIKSFIVSFLYVIIPVIVFIIVVSTVISVFGENSGFIILIIFLLFFIAMIFIGLLLTVALCRLAETNSISAAIDITSIYEIGKQIGLLKIFGVIIVCNVILGILSMLGSFISIIPILGTILVMYLLYTYIELVSYRAYALLYRDRNLTSSQMAFQQPYTPIEDGQNQQLNNEVKDFKSSDNTESIDFQQDINQNNENVPVNEDTGVKLQKCSKCGYSNPDYVNICVNCGNEL